MPLRARFGLSFWERRKSRRHRLFEPATVFDAKGEKRAHVLDLSATGLLLHSSKPLSPGTNIALTFAKQPVVGRVMWADHRYCGIAFLEPLTEERVREIVANATSAQAA